MPLQATSGAASYDAFGGGVAAVPNYIEDVFSTWLYTGNGGGTTTISNGVNLAEKGGLVWIKNRTTASTAHWLFDSARGFNTNTQSVVSRLETNATTAEQGTFVQGTGYTFVPQNNGFQFAYVGSGDPINQTSANFTSWTFRKQPKFFDCVTYTGNDVTSRQISHSLGSVPGCIIVKCTSNSAGWVVYHRSLSTDSGTVDSNNLILNSTASQSGGGCFGDDQYQTSSYFTLGRLGSGFNDNFNRSGRTYVAYLFAHDAGGFGESGEDNVISCGSFLGLNGPQIDLGWEPQWLLIKPINYCATAGDWFVIDNMRGARGTGVQLPRERFLHPNTTIAESLDSGGTYGNCDSININSTGFKAVGYPFNGPIDGGYRTYIYIAIRRGPMKVPTTGTSVFKSVFGDGTPPAMESGFVVDAGLVRNPSATADNHMVSRLTGTANLITNSTAAEGTFLSSQLGWDYNTGFMKTYGATVWSSMFQRAPGFMDVCCYAGTSSARTVAHNLAAVPELMIVKRRDSASGWNIYHVANGNTKKNYFSTGVTFTSTDTWNSTTPTSSVFTLGTNSEVNGSGATYVAYLFASCPGVSKVGSYTGTGTTQTINCGFTGGARFVLIKRTDSTGDWYVWDTARGIVSGNDPYLLLNSTAAEVTSTDYIDTYSAGFEISSTAPTAINASGGTFIFLAIA